MRGVPFTLEELNYIREYHKDYPIIELAKKITAVFGNKRSQDTIRKKVRQLKQDRKMKKEKPIPAAKSAPKIRVPVPRPKKFKVCISSNIIINALVATDTGFPELAKALCEPLDIILAYNRAGGFPEDIAKDTRRFFRRRGATI